MKYYLRKLLPRVPPYDAPQITVEAVENDEDPPFGSRRELTPSEITAHLLGAPASSFPFDAPSNSPWADYSEYCLVAFADEPGEPGLLVVESDVILNGNSANIRVIRYLTQSEISAHLLGAPASSFPVDPPAEDAVEGRAEPQPERMPNEPENQG